MPADAAAKLPEIEHIKARKDGLDVLADIYRYAELGFDAIEPDDLALFRWYGIYTQRAEESAASGDPGPSDETDGLLHAADQVPERHRHLRAAAHDRAAVRALRARAWATSPPARTSSCTGSRIEDMPIVLDELNAVGLSFTQACGDVWRNVVGCPLAGVDGHELLDSRPLIAELERTFVGDKRFSNLPRKFKVSVSGCLHRCAQHEINDIGAGGGRARRRARLRRLGGRRSGRVRADGPAAGRVRPARGGGRGVRRRSPRSTATRASAPSARGRGSSSWSTSGASSGCGPRSSASSAARCRRRSRPPTRSIPTATTWACTPRSSRACTTSARRRCAAASPASR